MFFWMFTPPSRAGLPSRYRHPLQDPDPALAGQYRKLFARYLSPPLPEQVELLGRALLQSDELADAWLDAALALGREQSGRMLEQAARNGVASVPDAPAALVALLSPLEMVPLWVDLDKLRLGGTTYRRTGIFGHFVLADFGLMGGYRSAAVAKTLMMTGKLRYGATERLIHTGRFVTAATEPGDILPGRPGYVSTLQVRMVHAYVRRTLLASADWKTEAWGLPINQSDTLGTNLLFSIGFLEGCKKWGLRFSAEEIDAVLHLWRYIGYLIGIDQALLPVDEATARRALYLVGCSQPDPDDDSEQLAQALYQVPLSFDRPPWAKRIIAAEMRLRVSMTRRILGDNAVDQLGLPKSRLRALLPPMVAVISSVERARQHLPGATKLAYKVGDYIVKQGERALSRELEAQKARRPGDGHSTQSAAMIPARPSVA